MIFAALLLLPQGCLPAPLRSPQETEQAQEELALRERSLGVMGTDLRLKVYGQDPSVLERALDEATREIQRVEDLMTDWRPSELTRLNESAGQGPTRVSRELAELILRALEIGKMTGGAFDVTYAGVGQLWDFKATPPRIPEPEAVESALAAVGFERVVVDLDAATVDLPAGMRIGLGGIAKGYGVDRAMAVFLEHGIQHGLVSAGGDLKALGRKAGELWEIAIRHPRDRERVLAVLPVSNTCVMTSGDYERFFEYEGRRYHHILDPRTGYPSTGCMSATVTAPDAAFADAIATALCILSPSEGLALVERLPRTEAILVDIAGQVHVSSGLSGVAGTPAGR